LVQGWGELDEEIIIAEICERYGWTLDEYQSQPWWFLDIIRLKLRLEGEHSKIEMDKLKRMK